MFRHRTHHALLVLSLLVRCHDSSPTNRRAIEGGLLLFVVVAAPPAAVMIVEYKEEVVPSLVA
jgi:hypothetical protein